jgi:L-ascorbate metabolism protein UlaG (beta-lactamase superfamily)
MHINWFGLSCFKIVSKDVTIFTDPFGKASGLTPARGAADILISSNPDNDLYNNFSSFSGDPFLVDGPGEYDVKSAFIRGIPLAGKPAEGGEKKVGLNRRAIYAVTVEGLTLGFLGGLNVKTLTDSQIEELSDVDILLVPVGGGTVCDAEAAMEIVNQIEPKVVIPMHYKTPGLSVKLDALDRFLKEIGGKSEEMDKLLIKKSELEEEKTRLVILTPQRS